MEEIRGGGRRARRIGRERRDETRVLPVLLDRSRINPERVGIVFLVRLCVNKIDPLPDQALELLEVSEVAPILEHRGEHAADVGRLPIVRRVRGVDQGLRAFSESIVVALLELSEEERREWVRTEVPRIRRTVRKYKAILYFQDEANIALTAFLGKTWAPRGKTPKQRVTGKRGGVSAMSAITSRGQLLFRLHDKRICSEEVIEFLSQMLQHHKRRHLVVVMDQAPPHVSKRTKAYIASQPRLHVFHLPKYSPDWNPDEKVWNHLKHQELKGHQATTKGELQQLTQRKLEGMAGDRRLLQGIFFRCCVAELVE